jgi:hypothetical protein
MAMMRSSRRPWRRAERLALLAAGALACGSEPTAPASRAEQFDALWEEFDRTYPYFDYKQIDWDAARVQWRDPAVNAVTMDEFAVVLAQMLAPLRDLHVYFEAPTGGYTTTYVPNAGVNWSRPTWQTYVQQLGWNQVGNWGWGVWGDVGYIAIGGWTDGQFRTADFDAALEQLRNAPSLIIDVRMNGGGNDALAFSVAQRFADRSRLVGYTQVRNGPAHGDLSTPLPRFIAPRGAWQYLKPVTVLAGRAAYISNESFIAAMRELPQVTVLGDTTGGATANPLRVPLGEGWYYTVSTWIETTADGRVIEWQGIPPDLYIPWSSVSLAGGVDETLEAAIARAHETHRP